MAWSGIHRIASLTGALAVATVIVVGAAQFAPSKAGAVDATTLQAETFAVSPASAGNVMTDTTAPDGSALKLAKNSTASTSINLPAAAPVTVKVAAKADQCRGWPSMTVSIDSVNVIQTSVGTTTWTDYPTQSALNVSAGQHTLSVTFSNDFTKGSRCDRNLYIDTVTLLANTSTTSTTPTTTSTTPTTTSTTPTTTSTTPTTTTTTGSTATPAVPFAVSSPYRTKLPATATVSANSATMIARIARDGRGYANLNAYAIPIYIASSSTPTHTVKCTITNWGPCPFDGQQVPIPNGATPASGGDGAMVVIHPDSNRIYEFWQAKYSGSQWTTSFGAINALDGSGWGGNSTGSGASRLAGVIRVNEIAQGVIPHALALQIDNVCASTYWPPAIKTDGGSTRSDCIPEGARLRLDPTLNLSTLSLSSAERMVAQALQTYGGFVMDQSGSPLSVSFERDTSAAANAIGATYQQAGLRWDYDGMDAIPWSRLQVLSP